MTGGGKLAASPGAISDAETIQTSGSSDATAPRSASAYITSLIDVRLTGRASAGV